MIFSSMLRKEATFQTPASFRDDLAFQKWGLILALLHSESPKLYTILAFMSAIGLNRKKNVPIGAKLFPKPIKSWPHSKEKQN